MCNLVTLGLISFVGAVSSSANLQAVALQQATALLGREKSKPNPIKAPTYAEWKAVWEGLAGPSNDVLAGQWKWVGHATTPKCREFGGIGDKYDHTGIRNPDGSFLFHVYAAKPMPMGDDVFAVKLLNLGVRGTNQGPYTVSAQEPQFSIWTYRGEYMVKDMYQELSCRHLVRNEQNLLVCMAQLKTVSDKTKYKCATPNEGLVWVMLKKDERESL